MNAVDARSHIVHEVVSCLFGLHVAFGVHARVYDSLVLQASRESKVDVQLSWNVGGAMVVDSTEVFWGRWDETVKAFPNMAPSAGAWVEFCARPMHSEVNELGVPPAPSAIAAEWKLLMTARNGTFHHLGVTSSLNGTTEWGKSSMPNKGAVPYQSLFSYARCRRGALVG